MEEAAFDKVCAVGSRGSGPMNNEPPKSPAPPFCFSAVVIFAEI
jgi:hypothetical protein